GENLRHGGRLSVQAGHSIFEAEQLCAPYAGVVRGLTHRSASLREPADEPLLLLSGHRRLDRRNDLLDVVQTVFKHTGFGHLPEEPEKIGRASCRERVEISVASCT